MAALPSFDIDYSKRCDVPIELRSLPPFSLQVSGFTAAELREEMADKLVDVVKASLRRRGVPDDELVTIGEPERVKLRGQSGRPR